MLQVDFSHRFSGRSAVRNDGAADLAVNFEQPAIGTIALFGPSGAGKTSVLQALAGLFRPQHGRIVLGERVLLDTERGIFVPPEQRRLGIVFQNSRLFPHVSVSANLAYGARRAPRGGPERDGVVALLGIAPLLARRPATLSGGERQRVAIARALLSNPLMLLMDEPLASLDTARKQEVLPYLARLKDEVGLPIIYVSHAFDEVARLADTLVLLERGRVSSSGPLGEVSARADVLLSERDDAGAVLTMKLVAHDPERRLSILELGPLRLLVPRIAGTIGARVRVRIPAREIILATAVPYAISLHNVIEGSVHSIVDQPAREATLVEIACGIDRLLARVTPDAVSRLSLAPGTPVFALVKSVSIDVLI